MNAPIDTLQTEDTFSTDPSGLDTTHSTPLVELADGDRYEMRISAVANQVGDDLLRMLAYNQSIPGPTLRVRQGSEVSVTVRNDGDSETTVHWHGLRLENQYDGVPNQTQDPIPVGGSYTYRLRFPDAGLYWYHPHVREDYGLDMGLYGSIVVDPVEPDYWPPVNREFVVTLDDILVEDGQMSSFRRSGPTHTAMGRFGNVMLTAGQTELDLQAGAGEVVRLQLTNTANTRIFNFGVTGARMKLIGGDSGRYEHEELVETVLLAPSERAIVDVLLDAPGRYPLVHQTPQQTYRLGTIDVREEATRPSFADKFETLRT